MKSLRPLSAGARVEGAMGSLDPPLVFTDHLFHVFSFITHRIPFYLDHSLTRTMLLHVITLTLHFENHDKTRILNIKFFVLKLNKIDLCDSLNYFFR